MKTTSMRLKVIILSLSTLILLNCEQEKKAGLAIDYKYSDQTSQLACKEMDTLLINEAFYSFRDDIINFYTTDANNLPLAYRNFTNDAINGRADYQTIVSEHTKDIFKALKQTPGLWRVSGDSYTFDFNGSLFNCISENLKDEEFKRTINALLSTNSMSSRMIKEPLRSKTYQMRDDPYLASMVAFDLYYGKLFDVDLSVPAVTPEAIEAESGSHEGHNH